MREAWLGKKRGEWVAYLRAVEKQKKARRYGGSAYDDGMCHGIIPFGAVHQWKSEADRRLADALGQPQAARIVGWDATGLGLALLCPWCGAEHRHIVTEEWDAETPLLAACGKGTYRVALTL